MLKRLFKRWADAVHVREAGTVLTMLKAMDEVTLGVSLMGATNSRHYLAKTCRWDLLRPRELVDQEPWCTYQLVQLVKKMQRDGDLVAASTLMVWVHTLRAAPDHASARLKQIVCEMWRLLHLGDDHVVDARFLLANRKGEKPNIDDFHETPDGFRIDREPIKSSLTAA